MVDLTAPSYIFGPEPDRSKPVQAYPGVSSVSFDPASQLAIYKESLLKEKAGMFTSERRYRELQEKRRRRRALRAARDSLGSVLEADTGAALDADARRDAAGSPGRRRSPTGSNLSALPPLRHSRSDSAVSCQPPLPAAGSGPCSWLGASKPPGSPQSAITAVSPDASMLSASAPAGPTPSEIAASKECFLAERRHENVFPSRRGNFGMAGGYMPDYDRPPSVAPKRRPPVVPVVPRR
mmetsp:Transcript_7413/g.23378  ORF Transcript_7413/g.23378 Transcript_7413/m.23378 type:complete len:238 (+) Transcript_7413:76-789(+)